MLNQEQYAKDYAKLHASYEKQAYLIFKRALDKQCKAVAEEVRKNGVSLLTLILPALIDRKHMQEAYVQAYTEIGIRHARNYSKLIDSLTKPQKAGLPLLETKLRFSSEFWRNIMVQFFEQEAAGKVTEVDSTTRDRIKKLLAEAQELNLSVTQQADYLYRNLNDIRFNTTRAMLIARTESTTAANKAASQVAQEADFRLKKLWVAALDSRTRNSHRIVGRADPIALDALFQVPSPNGMGMEYARFPGDVTLSVGNVAMCRCVVAHEPELDSEGLPVPIRR